MQIEIDTLLFESMFAHFKMAAHLVGCIGDTIVAHELGSMGFRTRFADSMSTSR